MQMAKKRARIGAEYVILFLLIVALSTKHASWWIWIVAGIAYVASMAALRAIIRDTPIEPKQRQRPFLG
jgi:hypothetical protein